LIDRPRANYRKLPENGKQKINAFTKTIKFGGLTLALPIGRRAARDYRHIYPQNLALFPQI
jgi:hypothetical protein